MPELPELPELAELPELRNLLFEARRLGYLGPGDVEAHIRHSGAFACLVASLLDDPTSALPHRLADLGSGGGIPALLIAASLKTSARCVLIEGSDQRAAFLGDAVRRLSLAETADVIASRAEEVGRRPELRGTFDLVTARAFGRPAVAVECAAPLLRVGGYLVVSEPPRHPAPTDSTATAPADSTATAPTDSTVNGPAWPPPLTAATRWRPDSLVRFGLEIVGPRTQAGLAFMVLRQIELCPAGVPRRVGIPEKRPLF